MVKKGRSTSNGNGINTATNTYKDPWMQKQQENYFTNFENDLCMVTMPPPPRPGLHFLFLVDYSRPQA